jgi:outer membrane protein assembly factor BamE (lipoprotein component of BamABCDE complex)
MKKRGILILALCALLVSVASAQTLDDRVRDLERRVEQLEKQLAQKALSPVASAPIPNDGWKKKESWQSLKRGMGEAEVRTLFGEPEKMNSFSTFTVWRYPANGEIRFDKRGSVEDWTEPR